MIKLFWIFLMGLCFIAAPVGAAETDIPVSGSLGQLSPPNLETTIKVYPAPPLSNTSQPAAAVATKPVRVEIPAVGVKRVTPVAPRDKSE